MVSNNRKSVGRFLSTSRILFFASLLILVFFSINLTKQIINRRDLQKDVDKLQNQIDSLQSKNQELAGLLDYFKSLDFVESEARTKLNLSKPGEKIIIVPENTGDQALGQPSFVSGLAGVQTTSDSVSNVQKWRNYFFKQVF